MSRGKRELLRHLARPEATVGVLDTLTDLPQLLYLSQSSQAIASHCQPLPAIASHRQSSQAIASYCQPSASLCGDTWQTLICIFDVRIVYRTALSLRPVTLMAIVRELMNMRLADDAQRDRAKHKEQDNSQRSNTRRVTHREHID